MQKRLRPRMDLNFQSSDPKSDTLSIRPRENLISVLHEILQTAQIVTEKESGSGSGTTSSSLVQNTINLLTSITVADGITLSLIFKYFLKKMWDNDRIVLGFLV